MSDGPADCQLGLSPGRQPANLNPLSAFHFAPLIRARGAALSLLALAGCTTYELPTATATGNFQPAGGSTNVVLSEAPGVGIVGASSGNVGPKTIVVEEPEQATLERPFRLTFSGVGADQLMRRVAENSNIEWVGMESEMAGSSIVIDTTIRTVADLIGVVDVIAQASGLEAVWSGRKVLFRTPVDGDAANRGDSVLVRTPPLAGELLEVIGARFPVDCGNDGSVTVCVGSPDAVQRAGELIEVLNGRLGAVQWKVIASDRDLSGVIEALGLSEQIRASEIVQGKWLIAALDGRAIETVSDVVQAAFTDVCEPVRFSPQYVDAADAKAALVASGTPLCSEPAVVRETVLASVDGTEKGKAVAEMLRIDQAPPTARIKVYVVNSVGARSVGLDLEDFSLSYPGGFDLGRMTAVAGIGKTEGVRVLELTTDGKGQASVTQTDRITSDTLVTDTGAQFNSIQNRSVGLEVSVDGRLSDSGYVGKLTISDSVLDGETTLASSCKAAFSLRLGDVTRVCSYMRDGAKASADFKGVSKSRNSEQFDVYAVLDAHQVAALETFTVGLQ